MQPYSRECACCVHQLQLHSSLQEALQHCQAAAHWLHQHLMPLCSSLANFTLEAPYLCWKQPGWPREGERARLQCEAHSITCVPSASAGDTPVQRGCPVADLGMSMSSWPCRVCTFLLKLATSCRQEVMAILMAPALPLTHRAFLTRATS